MFEFRDRSIFSILDVIMKFKKMYFFFLFKKSKTAMTFTEMLLVVSLFAVLSISVFQAFSNGLKIWNYGTSTFAEEDISIFLDKISYDLRNMLVFSSIPFIGEKNRIEFAALAMIKSDSRSSEKRMYSRQIVKVGYGLDKRAKKIFRFLLNYGQALKSIKSSPVSIADNVDQIKFTYFYKEKDGLSKVQRAEIVPPSMIEVSVHYKAKGTMRVMVKRIDIPIGL